MRINRKVTFDRFGAGA